MRAAKAVAAACSAWFLSLLPVAAQTSMSVGYTAGTDFLPAFVAADKGFFAKHGLDVKLVRLALASNAPAALVSGSLQISMGTAPSLLLAQEGGLDLVAVSSAVRHDASRSNLDIVLRKGLTIADPKDLAGKQVCVPGVNSYFDVLFQNWLLQEHVDRSSVRVVECPFPQMQSMLRSSTVDAVLAIEPIRSRIIADGDGTAYAAFSKSLPDNAVMTLWSSTRDWAKKNPERVKDFVASLQDGIAFIAAQGAEAQAVEKKYLGRTAPFYPRFTTEIEAADFAGYEKATRDLGLLKKPVDLGQMVHP